MSRTFDGGASEYLTLPDAAIYNLQAYTYACWAYPRSSGGFGYGTLFVRDPAGAYSLYLACGVGDATTNLFCQQAQPNQNASAGNTVEAPALNDWSHIAVTFTSGSNTHPIIYINGVATTGPVVDGLPPITQFGQIMIGNDGGDGWDGHIAEFVIYDEALTAPQVAALAASTTGATAVQSAHIIGYWHLCGTASPEPDSSGNGNDAVVTLATAGPDSPGWSCSVTPVPTTSTPPSGVQGATLNVTVNGTLFAAGTATITFSGAGITVNSYSVQTSTQIVASITIAGGAAATARDITVANGSKTATLSGVFTVAAPSPALGTSAVATPLTNQFTQTPILQRI